MGCGTSRADLEKYQALIDQKTALDVINADLKRKIDLLKIDMENTEKQSNEQLNLYRYKIEVLVQMLAIEEKRQQTISKRLDTLKLALLNQGISNKTMSLLLAQYSPENSQKDEKPIFLPSAFDLSGAMSRMYQEIHSCPEDILHSFADSEGKIVSALSRDDFMRYLYNSTTTLTKPDVQILSLRFFDGETVCVPEFIDFFTQSSHSRLARSSVGAVRASLNLLQLEMSSNDEVDSSILPIRKPGEKIQTITPQTRLQAAIQKLVLIWKVVEEPLRVEFNDLEENFGGGHLVNIETFKEILDQVCGPKQQQEQQEHLKQIQSTKAISKVKLTEIGSMEAKIQWLRADEITLIASRFELGDDIDVRVFFNFFQETCYGTSFTTLSTEPFRFSQEWSTLKMSVKDDLKDFQNKALSNSNNEEEKVDSKWSKVRDARKQLATVKAFQTTHANAVTKRKNDTKPPLSTQSSDRSISTDSKVSNLQLNQINNNTQLSSPRTSSESPQESKRPSLQRRSSSKMSQQTLVLLYSKDPQGFGEELERRVETNGFLFTKATLKINLQDISPLTTENEINTFIDELSFTGDTVSSVDVIALLKIKWDNLSQTHQLSARKIEEEQQQKIEISKTVILSREKIIEELKLQAIQDPIVQKYSQDPKAFTNNLNLATNGSGNALTKDQLTQAILKYVPNVTSELILALLDDLNPKLRSKTNDILISSVISLIKERINTINKINKQIQIEEKRLATEKEISKRMAERAIKIQKLKIDSKADTIIAFYKLNPSKFKSYFESMSIEGKKKAILFDQFKTMIQSIVIDVKDFEIEQLQNELQPSVDKQSNQILITTILNHLKTRSNTAIKLFKELQKEEKAQIKDADTLAGKKSGGFCGGSTNDVYVPKKEPTELNPASIDPSKNSSNNNNTTNNHENNNNNNNNNNSNTPDSMKDQLTSPPIIEDTEQDKKLKPNPKSFNPKFSKNLTKDTIDTLVYSDAGEEKGDDNDDHSLKHTGGVALPGMSRWQRGDGIGFNEPKKPQSKLSKNQKSIPHDDDTLDSDSQRSAGLFDSDDNDEGDPFGHIDHSKGY